MPLPYCTSALLRLLLMTFFVCPCPRFASSSPPPPLVWMEELSCVAIKGGGQAMKAAAGSFGPSSALIFSHLLGCLKPQCVWVLFEGQHTLGPEEWECICISGAAYIRADRTKPLWARLCMCACWQLSNIHRISKGWRLWVCVGCEYTVFTCQADVLSEHPRVLRASGSLQPASPPTPSLPISTQFLSYSVLLLPAF